MRREDPKFIEKRKKFYAEQKQKSQDKFSKGGLSPKQKVIAAKAPPPNKITGADFDAMKKEKAGKVKPIKAVLGIAAMGLMGAKMLKDKNKKAMALPGVGAAALVAKKKQEILGKKRGGMGDATEYKKYLKGLKAASSSQKPKKTYSSMEEMRKAKGFKPGETPSEFNKRRMALEAGKKAAKATRVGKILLPIVGAGVAAQQFLKSKMKKDKKMGGGMIKRASGGPAEESDLAKRRGPLGLGRAGKKLKKYNVSGSDLTIVFKDEDKVKKMGGGMMQKPMGYDKGGDSNMKKTIEKAKEFRKKSKQRKGFELKYPGPARPGNPVEVYEVKKGSMMNKPMGYKSGKSIKVKCKLGKNKPTKMY